VIAGESSAAAASNTEDARENNAAPAAPKRVWGTFLASLCQSFGPEKRHPRSETFLVAAMSADTPIIGTPTVPIGNQTPTPAAAPSVNSPPPDAPAATGASAPSGAPASGSAPYGFQLQIDPETQRLIIEVRDPVTGFVIFQAPPKTAFSAVSGSTSGNSRGQSVDRDA